MTVPPTLMKYARRFWSLGYSRVLLVLAVLFSLVALATPIWSVTIQRGPSGWDTSNYAWLGVNTDSYRLGVYDGSSYKPYSAPTLPSELLALSSAVGTSYAIILVYVVFLVAVTLLFSTAFATRLPPMGLLVIAVFIAIVALAALLAPIAVIPNAAATAFGTATFSSGLWGSSTSATWGAGLSWWLLLVAVVLGILGVLWPYFRSLRQPVVRPPPPREWQVER